MKKITGINNEKDEAIIGAVSSESNRFNVFCGGGDEIILRVIKEGRLVAKEDFNEEEEEAWNTIFDNYGSFLDEKSSYIGLSIDDDRFGNRYYYLIW